MKRIMWFFGVLFLVLFLISGCATVEKTQYTIEDAKRPALPLSAPNEFVVLYEDYRQPIEKGIRGEDAARKKALKTAYEDLKSRAFMEAVIDISQLLSKPIPRAELLQMAERAAKDSNDTYLKESKIIKQEVELAANVMLLSLYLKIDKKKLKDAILASFETQELAFGGKEILPLTAPASTTDVHVASYDGYEMKVPEDIRDRNTARKETIQKIIEKLKQMAFYEAAEDVYHALAQPSDAAEYQRAVEKAGKNYPNFVMDFKITKQMIETRGPLSVQPEKVRVSAYFRIDKNLLKKQLVRERAITPVGKYKTYVELFWNVEGKEIHPEVIDSVIKTMEDYFAQKYYEVVQFEGIEGKLALLMKSENLPTDDLYSRDELKRFKAKLSLRNIDKKFVRGKQILAEYADLLIGVTIKAVGKVDNMVMVRLSADATLFERGDWVTLAHSEKNAAVPYIPGRPDTLTAVCRKATFALAQDIEPKIRKKLARRPAIDRVKIGEDRDFELVFKNIGKDIFSQINIRLRGSSKWQHKGADFPKRTITLSYQGRNDELAEKVELFLEGAGFKPGVPEYTSTGNKILFGGKQ